MKYQRVVLLSEDDPVMVMFINDNSKNKDRWKRKHILYTTFLTTKGVKHSLEWFWHEALKRKNTIFWKNFCLWRYTKVTLILSLQRISKSATLARLSRVSPTPARFVSSNVLSTKPLSRHSPSTPPSSGTYSMKSG